MKRAYLTHILCLLIGGTLMAQEPKAEAGPFFLQNATIYPVTAESFTGSILIEGDRIAALGADLEAPAGVTVIDCEGLSVYPGLIDGGTQIGLKEIGSIALTQDDEEIGDVNPHVKALTAVNPNSVHVAVNRMGGVTTALTVPSDGIFSGQAALIDLYGYTPEDMFAGFEAVQMRFPSSVRRSSWDRRTDEEIEEAKEKALKRVNKVWGMAKEYARIDSLHGAGQGPAPEYYPEMAALAPVLRGEVPMLIEVDAAEDILSAIEWVEKQDIRAIFTGVSEGWRVADSLAKAAIPVIAGPVQSLPTRSSDRYDRAYRNPGVMAAAGVQVALRTNGAENVRNLPFHAGFAATYGMGRVAALEAITIVPARIFGVEEELGSIEAGKRANLIVTDGDPFETRSQILHVFIDGWRMPRSSRQIRLYEEFLDRNP